MAAAKKKKQKSKTADSHAKLAAMKKQAHKASSKLAIESTKAMEMTWEVGGGGAPAATKKRKIEGAAAALSYVRRARSAEAAGKSKHRRRRDLRRGPGGRIRRGDGVDPHRRRNGMVEATGEVLGDGVASKAAGSMMRMVATGATAGGKAVSRGRKDRRGRRKLEPQSEKAAAYGKVKEAAEDKATWEAMAKKAADVSKKFSSAQRGHQRRGGGSRRRRRRRTRARRGSTATRRPRRPACSTPTATPRRSRPTRRRRGDAPASCAGGSKETIKKLASAMAAAHTVGANLAAA